MSNPRSMALVDGSHLISHAHLIESTYNRFSIEGGFSISEVRSLLSHIVLYRELLSRFRIQRDRVNSKIQNRAVRKLREQFRIMYVNVKTYLAEQETSTRGLPPYVEVKVASDRHLHSMKYLGVNVTMLTLNDLPGLTVRLQMPSGKTRFNISKSELKLTSTERYVLVVGPNKQTIYASGEIANRIKQVIRNVHPLEELAR